MHINLVIAEPIRSNPKQYICVIEFNSSFDLNFNNNIKFNNINLPCNKLNI